MAWSSARRSLCQNPHDGKNELGGGTPTKGSNRHTLAPTATRAPTPVAALVIALLAASGFADSSVVRYLEDDLQRILRTVLDFKLPAPIPAPVIAAALHSEGPYRRSLKAQFPDIYWDKTHLECYNFFQQYKDHFVTTGAMGPNQALFATTFFKGTALFQWQQHQHKIKDHINVPISWEGFKAFFYQSLSKSKNFINTI